MSENVGHLSVTAFKQRLDSVEPFAVLDVRERFERDLATIKLPATVREIAVPMNEIPARLEEIRQTAGSDDLVIYCHHGVRSMVASNWLVMQGLTRVINLDGGIDAWSIVVDRGTPRY